MEKSNNQSNVKQSWDSANEDYLKGTGMTIFRKEDDGQKETKQTDDKTDDETETENKTTRTT